MSFGGFLQQKKIDLLPVDSIYSMQKVRYQSYTLQSHDFWVNTNKNHYPDIIFQH